MTELTERQKEVLLYIWNFYYNNKFSPTTQEIADHFKIYESAIRGHLKALVRKKYIIKIKGKVRALKVINLPRKKLI